MKNERHELTVNGVNPIIFVLLFLCLKKYNMKARQYIKYDGNGSRRAALFLREGHAL